ncbi:hypothetical protein [Vibrio sp. PID23_8]|uniref:hypothetical protein n=1 Tax=Vibrio sp. PID23_8 TaxID=1583767 RepID=UPI00160100CF|nr:hypothetical protein [Vibrio sp. PID23_8]
MLASMTLLVGISFLPDSPYTRYRLLDIGSYKAAAWIYERIHFDDTPIDVAFFGTSHTMNGIDSRLVEQSLGDDELRVVNFAIPHFGRDMHYTLVKQLLESRKPKLIVLEVREQEARDLHPGTHYLAQPEDLYAAPWIVNLRYFGNLIRLPLRTIKTASYNSFPEFFGFKTGFSAVDYHGSHLNNAISWADGKERVGVASEQSLHPMKGISRPLGWLDELTFYLSHNANFYYVEQISELAEKYNVPIAYAYIPSFGAPDVSVFADKYPDNQWLYFDERIFKEKSNWADPGHLNKNGAIALSMDAANKLIPYFKKH